MKRRSLLAIAGATLISTFILDVGPRAGLAAVPRIAPIKAVLSFSDKSNVRKSIPIKDRFGKTVYWLSLEPDLDTLKNVVTLVLVLRTARNISSTQNLFYPPGSNLHGFQDWFFGAAYYLSDSPKTKWTTERVIPLSRLNIVVYARVVTAAAQRVAGSPFSKFQSLVLSIEVAPKQI